MPLYEYECRACGHRFELLVRITPASGDAGPACPSCQSENLERLLSLFAVSSEGTAQLHLKQGRKLGSKGREDKLRADIEATENHH